MKQLIISLSLTILLGPGIGHLYLKKFKKGFILIGLTLIAAVHFAMRVLNSLPNKDAEILKNSQIFKDYVISNPKIVFYYDIVFAAVWAYALVDAFMIARTFLPPKQNKKEDNNA